MWSFVSVFVVFFHLASWFLHQQHVSVFHSLLLPSNVPLCGQTTFYLPTHQQTGCFHFLTTMNTTATSIRRQVFMRTYVILSLGYILREVEGLGHIVHGILETTRLHSHTRRRWERFTLSPPPFYHPETIPLCFSFHSLMAQLLMLSSTLTIHKIVQGLLRESSSEPQGISKDHISQHLVFKQGWSTAI